MRRATNFLLLARDGAARGGQGRGGKLCLCREDVQEKRRRRRSRSRGSGIDWRQEWRKRIVEREENSSSGTWLGEEANCAVISIPEIERLCAEDGDVESVVDCFSCRTNGTSKERSISALDLVDALSL